MGDKVAIALVDKVLCSRLECVNIAQNGLGFKTGQFILNHLKGCCNKGKNSRIHLKKIELQFNLMSDSMVERIQAALAQILALNCCVPAQTQSVN